MADFASSSCWLVANQPPPDSADSHVMAFKRVASSSIWRNMPKGLLLNWKPLRFRPASPRLVFNKRNL